MKRSRLYASPQDDIWQRETGVLPAKLFSRRAGGSLDLIQRLRLERKLEGHNGCVNTVHFTPSGELLLSGSDDRQIIVWDWAAGLQRLSYDSGHISNVFQARAMPHTGDRVIVSCAADGQVRVGMLAEGGQVETRRLAKHRSRAHKLAVEPGSAHSFLSCGEDGVVRLFDLREDKARPKLLTCTSLEGAPSAASRARLLPVGLNAVVINPRLPHQFAVGGADEYARIYDLRKVADSPSGDRDAPVDTFAPRHLAGGQNSVHITCVDFSHQGELLVSYNDELIYLFDAARGGLGPDPAATLAARRRSRARAAAAAAATAGPSAGGGINSHGGSSSNGGRSCGGSGGGSGDGGGSGSGRHRVGKNDRGWERDRDTDRVRKSEGSGDKDEQRGGEGRRDNERERETEREGEGGCQWARGRGEGGGEGEDSAGRGEAVQVYRGHRNAQTVKGVYFMGPNTEYVTSGSDCGRIFIWKKTTGELVAMLRGDSQVVNCLEPHPAATILATSGIDSDVKIWTPTAERVSALPENAQKVMEQNGRRREERSRTISLSPEMIMHLLRLQRRHAELDLADCYPSDEGEAGRLSASDLVSDDDDDDASGRPPECAVA